MSYLMVWEFHVRAGAEEAFREAYGARGAWTRLFAAAEGYEGTQLLCDLHGPRRYLSIDRWESQAAWDRFRIDFAGRYAELDAQCQHLTESELRLGVFEPA